MNIFQVKSSDADSDEMIYDVSSPKTSQLFSDLQPFSQYDFRVACQNSQGHSDWTVWETISTNEGGKNIISIIQVLNCIELKTLGIFVLINNCDIETF